MQSQGVTVKTKRARESTSVACVGYQSTRQILAMAPSRTGWAEWGEVWRR